MSAGVGISIVHSSCFAAESAGAAAMAEMPFVHGLHADIRLGVDCPIP
jgi:hypothetical protein